MSICKQALKDMIANLALQLAEQQEISYNLSLELKAELDNKKVGEVHDKHKE